MNIAGTERVDVYNEKNGISKIKVMKTGMTTGQTFGELNGELLSFRIEHPAGSYRYFQFGNAYYIDEIPGEPHFFRSGDSGSGVFLAEGGRPGEALGIGIAYSTISNTTLVCKIDEILNDLRLTIVRQN